MELENGAKCVFDCVLQRPKRMVLEGLVRMVVGNEIGWSRKCKKNKKNRKKKERVVWSLERIESLELLVRE